MTRVNRLKEADWRREEPRILSFCLDRIDHQEGNRISMRDLYEAYQKWLRLRGHEPTKLSLDGFGRLFPKTYQRRSLVIGPETLKGVLDIRLK